MGAGIASGHEMGIKQQGRGMGLQAAAIASQINLNDSQAEKNRAEAEKTSGVDTRMQNANIDYIIAQTSNEKVKKGLIYANTRLLDAQEELQRTTVNYTIPISLRKRSSPSKFFGFTYLFLTSI